MSRKQGRRQFHVDLAYEYQASYKILCYCYLEIIDIFILVLGKLGPSSICRQTGFGKLDPIKLGPGKLVPGNLGSEKVIEMGDAVGD